MWEGRKPEDGGREQRRVTAGSAVYGSERKLSSWGGNKFHTVTGIKSPPATLAATWACHCLRFSASLWLDGPRPGMHGWSSCWGSGVASVGAAPPPPGTARSPRLGVSVQLFRPSYKLFWLHYKPCFSFFHMGFYQPYYPSTPLNGSPGL